jgi:hypothetical protein
MCVEETLGIFLYSYLYLKLPKTLYLSLFSVFSLQQNWRRGQNRFCLEVRVGVCEHGGRGPRAGRGEVAQTMYTYMNKCKNNKRKILGFMSYVHITRVDWKPSTITPLASTFA